jgi:hypothetical protein
MKRLIFWIKYKLGIAKEGKDFYTCGQYYFCDECLIDCKGFIDEQFSK